MKIFDVNENSVVVIKPHREMDFISNIENLQHALFDKKGDYHVFLTKEQYSIKFETKKIHSIYLSKEKKLLSEIIFEDFPPYLQYILRAGNLKSNANITTAKIIDNKPTIQVHSKKSNMLCTLLDETGCYIDLDKIQNLGFVCNQALENIYTLRLKGPSFNIEYPIYPYDQSLGCGFTKELHVYHTESFTIALRLNGDIYGLFKGNSIRFQFQDWDKFMNFKENEYFSKIINNQIINLSRLVSASIILVEGPKNINIEKYNYTVYDNDCNRVVV